MTPREAVLRLQADKEAILQSKRQGVDALQRAYTQQHAKLLYCFRDPRRRPGPFHKRGCGLLCAVVPGQGLPQPLFAHVTPLPCTPARRGLPVFGPLRTNAPELRRARTELGWARALGCGQLPEQLQRQRQALVRRVLLRDHAQPGGPSQGPDSATVPAADATLQKQRLLDMGGAGSFAATLATAAEAGAGQAAAAAQLARQAMVSEAVADQLEAMAARWREAQVPKLAPRARHVWREGQDPRRRAQWQTERKEMQERLVRQAVELAQLHASPAPGRAPKAAATRACGDLQPSLEDALQRGWQLELAAQPEAPPKAPRDESARVPRRLPAGARPSSAAAVALGADAYDFPSSDETAAAEGSAPDAAEPHADGMLGDDFGDSLAEFPSTESDAEVDVCTVDDDNRVNAADATAGACDDPGLGDGAAVDVLERPRGMKHQQRIAHGFLRRCKVQIVSMIGSRPGHVLLQAVHQLGCHSLFRDRMLLQLLCNQSAEFLAKMTQLTQGKEVVVQARPGLH
ncbi:hypothetical protein WJX81_005530 [Elliptochloris bilobata]|uniref:DUF7607 domain-containing protein n=1 Tax=Elliptochloris bilobata TaxID=381761 RepID=A0AAW1R3W4_9CHLO